MTKPQQPERHRSSRDPSDPAHVKAKAGVEGANLRSGDERTGPVPPDNQPGHHPDHDEDKPDLGPSEPA